MRQFFLNKNEGFTLIEVILSIAILSIVSVVVLRLFVTSHDLNESSRHADLASNIAVNHIEMIRGYNSLNALVEDMPWIEAKGDQFVGIRLYDKDFETAGVGSQKLSIVIVPTKNNNGLCDVYLEIRDDEDNQIVSYTTKHYFSEEVAQ